MKSKKISILLGVFVFLIILTSSNEVYAMHILEGFLPPAWAALWFAISLPILFLGIKSIRKLTDENPNIKMLLALCGAFAFVLSSLKLPSVTGSCSHPTGVGLGAILFGPGATSILALIVLLFQAILLAHGGLTTLGANVFSMGIAGPFVSYAIFKLLGKMEVSNGVRVFLAASIGNITTYIITSIQLGIAFPGEVGLLGSVVKFLGIFAITQFPLAVSEGLLTVVVYNLLTKYNEREIHELSLIREAK